VAHKKQLPCNICYLPENHRAFPEKTATELLSGRNFTFEIRADAVVYE
jgi:hypothetical protein